MREQGLSGKKRNMAKKRRKSKGLKGSYSGKAANRRRYSKISSGSPITRVVPRACAIRQSGSKKGTLRKGCRIGKNGQARCDELVRLPKRAKDRRRSKKGVMVDCPQ